MIHKEGGYFGYSSWPASILHGETTGSVRDHLRFLVLGCSGPQDNLTVIGRPPSYKNQKERVHRILKTSMKPCLQVNEWQAVQATLSLIFIGFERPLTISTEKG